MYCVLTHRSDQLFMANVFWLVSTSLPPYTKYLVRIDYLVGTWSNAHPVGMKASRLANMSPTVRLRTVNRIPRVTTEPMNRKSLRSLNINWKSALNFFLPMDTICIIDQPMSRINKSWRTITLVIIKLSWLQSKPLR